MQLLQKKGNIKVTDTKKLIGKKMISIVVPTDWVLYKDKHRLKWSYILGKGILALKGDVPSMDRLQANIEKMQMRLQQLIQENWTLNAKVETMKKNREFTH